VKKPKRRPKPSKSRLKSRLRPKVMANILSKPLRRACCTNDILNQIFQPTPIEESIATECENLDNYP